MKLQKKEFPGGRLQGYSAKLSPPEEIVVAFVHYKLTCQDKACSSPGDNIQSIEELQDRQTENTS